jgi:DNA-binding NtrC family response regulator
MIYASCRNMKWKHTSIFFIEKDPFYRALMLHALRKMGSMKIRLFENLTECLEAPSSAPTIILLDYPPHDSNADRSIVHLQNRFSDAQIILLTSRSNASTSEIYGNTMIMEKSLDFQRVLLTIVQSKMRRKTLQLIFVFIALLSFVVITLLVSSLP